MNANNNDASAAAQPSTQQRAPEHHLGRAASTINHDNTATKFFDTYRRVHQHKSGLATMEYAEIEGDNLQNTIADLVAFASSTAIPRNYVGDFQPPQSALNSDEPIHIITESVLLGYVGKIVKLLHFKFPQHEDYRGLDPRKSTDGGH